MLTSIPASTTNLGPSYSLLMIALLLRTSSSRTRVLYHEIVAGEGGALK